MLFSGRLGSEERAVVSPAFATMPSFDSAKELRDRPATLRCLCLRPFPAFGVTVSDRSRASSADSCRNADCGDALSEPGELRTDLLCRSLSSELRDMVAEGVRFVEWFPCFSESA